MLELLWSAFESFRHPLPYIHINIHIHNYLLKRFSFSCSAFSGVLAYSSAFGSARPFSYYLFHALFVYSFYFVSISVYIPLLRHSLSWGIFPFSRIFFLEIVSVACLPRTLLLLLPTFPCFLLKTLVQGLDKLFHKGLRLARHSFAAALVYLVHNRRL